MAAELAPRGCRAVAGRGSRVSQLAGGGAEEAVAWRTRSHLLWRRRPPGHYTSNICTVILSRTVAAHLGFRSEPTPDLICGVSPGQPGGPWKPEDEARTRAEKASLPQTPPPSASRPLL
ncbi:hypothetical protein SKAU_G00260100 [Synaphobranchus kaupii]|uniref:Uncharacterized protein n=1 Tax=Synaphobranchus kaupii TaxID=118154 RepID=A0A9Q1F4J1_SYNKA|nr:hypothetical protein SKAU_G00260100 [Synaphobranchus kaupii]